MGLFGPPDVAKLKAKRDVPGLIKALGFHADVPLGHAVVNDLYIRNAAARALGQVGDARAVQPLIVALNDCDGDVGRAAAEALGQVAGARAFEPLMAALRHGNWQVQAGAAKALGQIGDARAVEPLAAACEHGSTHDVEDAAAEALGKIRDPRAVPSLLVGLAATPRGPVR
jgi:HEAT repeat protein